MTVNPRSFTAYGISPVVSVSNGTEVPETYISWSGGQRRYVQLPEEVDEVGSFPNPGFLGAVKINVAEDIWREGAQAVAALDGGKLKPFNVTRDGKRGRFGFSVEVQAFVFAIWDAQNEILYLCEISSESASDCIQLSAEVFFEGNLDEVPEPFDALATALVIAYEAKGPGTIYAATA